MTLNEFCKLKLNDNDYHNIITKDMLTSKVTLLLGPNGSGKSRSLKSLKNELSPNAIMFGSKKNNIVELASNPFDFNSEAIICAFHSEGEQIQDSLNYWLQQNSDFILNHDGTLYMLIDELDSGLSYDRLYIHINILLNLIKDLDIKLVLTCNSYEMYTGFDKDYIQSIWLPTLEYVKLDSYQDFRQLYVDFIKQMT